MQFPVSSLQGKMAINLHRGLRETLQSRRWSLILPSGVLSAGHSSRHKHREVILFFHPSFLEILYTVRKTSGHFGRKAQITNLFHRHLISHDACLSSLLHGQHKNKRDFPSL